MALVVVVRQEWSILDQRSKLGKKTNKVKSSAPTGESTDSAFIT